MSGERKPTINIGLFIITIFTTILAGTVLSGKDPFHNLRNLIYGIPFSFTLLLILGSHEFGHYFACKRLGIKATLPFFIPAPFLLGTFGAVIKIKSPIPDRKGLMEVGAAGPLMGLIFAIPATIIGIKLSSTGLVTKEPGMISMGNSLLFWFLTKISIQTPAPGYDILLHPVAFAGWVGLFITSMNLLPIGQLDGGHISYSLFGRAHKVIGIIMVGLMIILGIKWPGWFMWALLVTLLGIKHPPPLNDTETIDTKHRMIGILSFCVFIITFIPCPIKV